MKLEEPTTDFIYELKTFVTLIPLKVRALVVGFYLGETGKQYQIAYFINGERRTVYVYEEELSPITGEERLGFVNG